MTKTVFNFRFFCFFKVKPRKLPKGIRLLRSKTDGLSTGAENEAFELEKLKGLQENASLCPRWLCKLDNLRNHQNEIKSLKSRAETLLIFMQSAA